MPPAGSGNLLAELRELVAKSIEANSRLIQNGAEFLRRAADQKTDIAKLASEGGEVLTEALRDYVRLSAVHTSRLIDLGLEVSDRLVGRAGAGRTAGSRPSPMPFDIRLSGVPGATCQTAFAIDNDHTEAVKVAFQYGLMVDEKGEEATDVEIRFDPAEATIPSGGQGRFVLSLTIPPDMPPGVHHTLVSVQGLPRLGFRLLLQVEEPGAAAKKPPPKKAPARKAAPRKAKKAPARTVGAGKRRAPKKKAAAPKKKASAQKKKAKKKAAARTRSKKAAPPERGAGAG